MLLALACQLLDPAWECFVRLQPWQSKVAAHAVPGCQRQVASLVLRARGGPRTPSTEMPSAVQELASADFLRRLRDGGPQAERSEDLPVVNASWVAKDAHETARNVVNALCQHRFGAGVRVDEVIAGQEAAKGTEFIVTLALSDRSVFGSASSGQVQHFDRDTTALLEQLKELHEWKLGIYRLKVQTPGVEEELKSLDDLWKCEFFPCYVEWVKGTSRYSRYLVLDQQKTASAKERATIWRLADCSENHIKGHMLTAKQKSQEFEILHEDFLKVRTHIDKKSYSRIKKAREVLRSRPEAATEEEEAEDEDLGDPEADEMEWSK